MKIGIQGQYYFPKSLIGYINKLIINKLILSNTSEEFIFFANKHSELPSGMPQNAKIISEPLGFGHLLYSKKEKPVSEKTLKKYSIDIFISFEPAKFKTPYCIILHDDSYLEKLKIADYGNLKYIIISSSELYSKILKINILKENILLVEGVYHPVFCPATYNEKLDTREKYTGNREFFICTDFNMDTGNFIFLLKAFSAFKERLQSTWRLITVLRSKKEKSVLENLLSSYKYRDDVVLLGNIDETELSLLVATAYSLISVSNEEIFPVHVFEASACEIPVIARNTETMKQYSDVLLTFTGEDPISLADKMMQLYKNETLKQTCAENIKQLTARYATKNSFEALQLVLRPES